MDETPKTSPFATASLILGFAGLPVVLCCSLGCFLSIAGTVCGHIGLIKIERSNGTLQGRNICLAGLILSYAGFIMTILILAWFFVEHSQNYVYIKGLGYRTN